MLERAIQEQLLDPQKEKALKLQEKIFKSTWYAKQGFIPKLDAVAVLGHKSTFLNIEYFGKEPWSSYMDTDRVTEAVYFWKEASKAHYPQQPPTFAYTGSKTECRVFNESLQRGLIDLPKNYTICVDKIIRDGVNGASHLNTADNIEALYQQLTYDGFSLSGAKNIALVSHLAHFVRIPFYIERFKNIYDPEVNIKFYPYAVDERPNSREPFLNRELKMLDKYRNLGYLSEEPAELAYFNLNSE